MKKVIICDKNKELIDFLKENIQEGIQPSGITLEIVYGDVIELHNTTENSKIVTASNPEFNPGGGLDALLASKYSWSEAKEFSWNNDLFFVVSVDRATKANKKIITRALAGVLGYAHKFVPIITGIGTAIGGLPMQELLEAITDVLISADLRSANLIYANLSSADLSSADLRSANLISANLSSADLSSADLRSADLRSANLISANLSSADLSSADLSSADLRSANLIYANLRSANLSSANLIYANLSSANLSSANLSSANLIYANLSSANLIYANLSSVRHNEHTAFFALQCPEEGAFIAWKKASGNIIKLEIPAKAKRSSATSRKCRASQAKVLAIYDKDGNELKECVSSYDESFVYRVGRIVKPIEKFDADRWNECSTGIHFFITRREAELY